MIRQRETLLIVEDDYLIRWSLREEFRAHGYAVCEAESLGNARACIDRCSPDIILLDEHLPDGDGTDWIPVVAELPNPPVIIMLTAEDDVGTVVKAMKTGVAEYITKPYEIGYVLAIVDKVLQGTVRERALRDASRKARSNVGLGGLLGVSNVMKTVFTQVEKFAVAERTSVLIQGESGTGKEVTARVLHDLSPRREAPFLAVNCSAIPSELAESELFGHERGSFTNAHRQRKGMFEMADGGTLFLDEVGELPPHLQPKLLRVLEDGTFRRVGGTEELRTDVRVLSATKGSLEDRIERNQFREDLYYRLCVARIILPPLSERESDIDLLARHFLMQLRERYGNRTFEPSEEGWQRLLAYDWPGNVRQLKNCLERAIVLGDVSLGILCQERATPARPCGPDASGTAASLAEMERRAIRDALDTHDGNQTRAARALGISRDTLRYRMKKFGMERR